MPILDPVKKTIAQKARLYKKSAGIAEQRTRKQPQNAENVMQKSRWKSEKS